MSRFAMVCSVVALFGASFARAADLPGTIVMDEVIAVENPCADSHVLERILQRFEWAEVNTWHRGLSMVALANGRLSDHPYFEPGIIKRQYCRADARMSDESARTVFFAIEFGQGFASIGNYVDFCVLGLDPWRVHDEACRTVR